MKKTDTFVFPEPPAGLVEYCRELEEFVSGKLSSSAGCAAADDESALVLLEKERVMNLANSECLEELLLPAGCAEGLSENFHALVELYCKHFPEAEDASALKKAMDEGAFPLSLWQEAGWQGAKRDEAFKKIASDYAIDQENLLQLAHWAAAPYRRKLAEQYREAIKELISYGRKTCPVCARTPELAELSEKEHGRRYLTCLPCDLKWHYKRTGCVFCDNMDYDKLGYIVMEGCKSHKVYACDVCKHYIKTMDLRQPFESLTPAMENARTFFLDLLAVENGYR